jgi:hypothetical protein
MNNCWPDLWHWNDFLLGLSIGILIGWIYFPCVRCWIRRRREK